MALTLSGKALASGSDQKTNTTGAPSWLESQDVKDPKNGHTARFRSYGMLRL